MYITGDSHGRTLYDATRHLLEGNTDSLIELVGVLFLLRRLMVLMGYLDSKRSAAKARPLTNLILTSSDKIPTQSFVDLYFSRDPKGLEFLYWDGDPCGGHVRDADIIIVSILPVQRPQDKCAHRILER